MVQKGQLPPQAYLPNFMQGNPMQPPMPQGGGAPQVPGPGGVGGAPVNPIGPATPNPEAPAPASQAAEQIQSKQLLDSVPIK